MKSFIFALLAIACALEEGKGRRCDEHKPERERLPQECEKPCDLKPRDCGLGKCQCPNGTSGLWYGARDAAPSQPSIEAGKGLAYCQDFIFNCNIKCEIPIISLGTQKDILAPQIPSGYELKGACIAEGSFDRPECFLPEGGRVTETACGVSNTRSNIVLKDGKFLCVSLEPQALKQPCYKECPCGFYPTCLYVKSATF